MTNQTFLYPPGKLSETSIEEYWQTLEERISSCDRVINTLKRYCETFPHSSSQVISLQSVTKYQNFRRIWLEEQLRCEEWLIDHDAKGWVSS